MPPDALEVCQNTLGHRFRDEDLLRQALTHASVAESRARSNERLEFLGDAVLALVICDFLHQRYPDFLEGDLTQIKSAVVSRKTCADVAQQLGLPALMKIGKGMGGRNGLPDSLAAAVFEAVIAALYLDAGLEPTRAFILRHLTPQVEQAVASEHQHNYKSQLQQYAQRVLGATPIYELLDEKGPDHSKAFEVAINIRGRRFASAWGTSKKDAEQKAALNTLRALKLVDDEGRSRTPDEE